MRAFIAIKLPSEIKEEIHKFQKSLKVACGERSRTNGVRWVAPENIHLTLKFLGEINESQVESITSAINSSIKGIKSFNTKGTFSISLSEFGAFPDFRRPRVLWLGVKEGKEELIQLMINLENSLCKLGIEQEKREPVPHITIGRANQPIRVQSPELRLESIFLADAVYLIKSVLTPQGPIYTDLSANLLGGYK